jgi:hypothetical protein
MARELGRKMAETMVARPAGCSAEGVWAPFGRVDVEMPIWRKRRFPADILALPNSQPCMEIDDGRALETEFSEFGWLQQRGD